MAGECSFVPGAGKGPPDACSTPWPTPSAACFTLLEMLVRARLVCSDRDCAVVFEAVGDLAEVETLGCECGCGLQVLGWPDPIAGRDGAGVVLTPLGG